MYTYNTAVHKKNAVEFMRRAYLLGEGGRLQPYSLRIVGRTDGRTDGGGEANGENKFHAVDLTDARCVCTTPNRSGDN